MTNMTKLLASLVLVFGLVSMSNAASVLPAMDGFKLYQTDTDTDADTDTEEATEEEKKKKEGEEEEPDC